MIKVSKSDMYKLASKWGVTIDLLEKLQKLLEKVEDAFSPSGVIYFVPLNDADRFAASERVKPKAGLGYTPKNALDNILKYAKRNGYYGIF